MTLLELIEVLTGELGLDLSGDSIDGSRGVYVNDAETGRPRPLESAELDQDGDLILEYQP